jgi:hypothetical protein
LPVDQPWQPTWTEPLTGGGIDHSYSSYGGFVAGFGNTLSGSFASVSGGSGNTASGKYLKNHPEVLMEWTAPSEDALIMGQNGDIIK